jgi:hypothetical protein
MVTKISKFFRQYLRAKIGYISKEGKRDEMFSARCESEVYHEPFRII